MNKLFLTICVICYFINFSCSQKNDNRKLPKIEINLYLSDDFFNTKTYSRGPSSMKVYKNDTMVLDTVFDIIEQKEENAFIADQYNKKFVLSECKGIAIKDTMLIEFRSSLMEDYLLSIKISNGYYQVNFTEGKLVVNHWTPIKERLVLNKKDFTRDQEIKGMIEIELALIDAGIKKDSAVFYGPFYYKVLDSSDFRGVQ